MLKKLVSCMLAVTIVISGMSSFVMAAETDKGERAIDVVTGLKIVPEVADFEAVVTRAEFSSIALRLYDEEITDEFSEGVNTVYADVTAEHYKSGDIARVSGKGIMRGYSDGAFHPEESLQLAQAVKIILDMLGYAEFVEYNGGYPAGYMQQAVFTGLVSGINKSAYDAITYSELCRIIYNAIKIPMVTADEITSKGITYTKDNSANFLSKYHNIYKAEGVVSANFVTKINGASLLEKNELEIAGIVYKAETEQFDSLVGYNTEYYYENGSDGDILHCAVAVNNEEVELFGRDITYAGENTVHYDIEEEKKGEIALAENGNIIYNGVYLCKVINYDLHNLVDMTGNIRFIDTNRDNRYDVIFVTEYQNYILEKALVDEEMIFLKGSKDYIEYDKDTVCIIKKGEEVLSLSDIPSESLASVAMSDDFFNEKGKRQVIVALSPVAITGKVDSISDKEVFISVTEGKNTTVTGYKESKNYIGENNAVITLRSSGLFHLDALGEIGYFQQGADSMMQYGYIIAAEQSPGLRGKYEIRLLNESSEIVQYIVDDNLKVDGYKRQSNELDSILMASSSMPGEIKQLIRFSVNADGQITSIDTILENGDNDILALSRNEVSKAGVTWSSSLSTFSVGQSIERYIVRDGVKLFVIPTSFDATEEDYAVHSTTYLANSKVYGKEADGQKLIMYNIEEAEPAVMELRVDAVSAGLGGISQYNSDLAVIEKVRHGFNKNEDECLFIDIMVSNAKRTLTVPKDRAKMLRLIEESISGGTGLDMDNKTPLSLSDLKFGDCILYYEDEKGDTLTILRLNNFNIFEACEEGPVYYGVENMGSYLERMWASVRDINKKKMLLDINHADGDLYLNAVSGSIQYYLVDSETKTVTKASIDSIIYSPYDEYADKIFVRTRAGVIKQIIIYR